MYINEIHINLFCCGGHFLSFCNSLELLGLISQFKHFFIYFLFTGRCPVGEWGNARGNMHSYLGNRLARLRTHIVPAGGNTWISCWGYDMKFSDTLLWDGHKVIIGESTIIYHIPSVCKNALKTAHIKDLRTNEASGVISSEFKWNKFILWYLQFLSF